MAAPRYPTPDGLEHALDNVAATDVGRLASTAPVLLAVEAALVAGQSITLSGHSAVPNPRIFAWLDQWFDISGSGRDYFVPFRLPGGASRHRRDEKILAQGTMTAAKTRAWVLAAEPVPNTDRDRAYPLVDLVGWRRAVADGLSSGFDLALLGVWLGRVSGIPAASPVPTRDELVAFALSRLGLPTDGSHPLCLTAPPIITETGEDSWDGTHFGDTPLTLEEIAEVCERMVPTDLAVTGGGGSTIAAVTLPEAALELDDHVRRMLRVSIASSKAVMLVGPPGTGKTEIVSEIESLLAGGQAGTLGITTPPAGIVTVTPDDEWSSTTLIGGITLDESKDLRFRTGYVLDAIANNKWLLLDEANRGDLDKIFGGLLTWLSGKPVQVGMTSTAIDAQPILLEWSDNEDCAVDGLDQLAPGATVDRPVRFIAGKNWRFLGTFNPVDAQRVFKLGQALGRRFRRVPVPPPSPAKFQTLITSRAAALDPSFQSAVRTLYSVHDDFDPPLGPAPFLDLCEYLLTATAIGEGVPSEPDGTAQPAEGVPAESVTEEPHEGDSDLEEEIAASGEDGEHAGPSEGSGAGPEVSEDDSDSVGLEPSDSRLLAEGYIASLGTWLAQLTPAERAKMRARLVPNVFSSTDWTWLDRMFRSL